MDAGLAVDRGKLIFHPDGLGGADVRALAAADAFVFLHLRTGSQRLEHDLIDDFSDGAGSGLVEKDARLGGHGLKIRNDKPFGFSRNLQFLRCLRDQSAHARGLQGRDVVCREANELGGEKVKLRGGLGGENRSDFARRALRGAVSLHADDGVTDAEAGFKIRREVDQHVRKVGDLRVFIVVLRLHRTGNDTKVVFDGVRHAHHAVGLELAEVDDRVGSVEIGGIGEFLCADGLRERSVALREVLIELRTDGFAVMHAADVIHVVQVRGRIESAGAVSEKDACAAFPQHFRQLAKKHWVRRGRLLRLHGRDEVDLDDNVHALFDPVEPTKRGERLRERSSAFFRVIAFAGNNRNIDSHI